MIYLYYFIIIIIICFFYYLFYFVIAWKEFFLIFWWFEFDTLIIIICCISLFSFYWICLIFIYLFTYYTFHLFIHIFLFTYLITSSNFSETNSTFNHLNYFDFRYARDCLTNFNWIIFLFYPLLFYFYLQSPNFISFHFLFFYFAWGNGLLLTFERIPTSLKEGKLPKLVLVNENKKVYMDGKVSCVQNGVKFWSA